MPDLDIEKLQQYRAQTFRLGGTGLKTIEQAVDYVNERGFIFFWPIKGIEMPSLWTGVAGDRPVADEHDDPGHITWGWKDELLGKKRWYYARLLRRRNTIISLETAPYFYALSPNYGDPENDYREEYHAGTLSLEEKLIYEALLNEGPLHTLALRRASRLAGEASQSRFARALDNLQINMRILPTGVSDAGAWHYAFVYDIVPRFFPALQEIARQYSEKTARHYLAMRYFQSVGAAPRSSIARLFSWQKEEAERVIQLLVKNGELLDDISVNQQRENWLALPSLTS